MRTARIVVLLAIVFGGVMATSKPAHALGIFLQWQDTDNGGSSYGLGLKHKFSIVPLFGIEARASWLKFDDLGPENVDMFPLEAFGRFKMGLFYVGGGLGYYLFSGDIKPDDTVGGFGAGGAEFTLFGLGGFAELRYLVLKPTGIDLSGFGANAGVILPI